MRVCYYEMDLLISEQVISQMTALYNESRKFWDVVKNKLQDYAHRLVFLTELPLMDILQKQFKNV